MSDDRVKLLPARMLNEFVYCPRLFYLEWVQGQFADSADTLEGTLVHRSLEEDVGGVREPVDQDFEGMRAKSVYLSGPALGLVAKIDILEGEKGKAVPVEYKKGSVPDNPELSWDADRVQLCAQALILRENGYKCDQGVIFYAGSKRRVTIEFTRKLVARTRAATKEALRTSEGQDIPPPLQDSPKCPRCSLVGICLPDEVNVLRAPAERLTDVRRLFPARDEALPLYVTEQGATVGKSGETVEVRRQGRVIGQARILDVSQLCLFGSVLVTSQLIHAFCDTGRPIVHYSFGGWFYGITFGMWHKNVELRRRQYRIAESGPRALAVARSFVVGKIRNCRTMLRRNHPSPSSRLNELNRLATLAGRAREIDSLRGIEGAAANVYFSGFGGMIRSDADFRFDFSGRNRRPPTDPVNALLSFTYALLVKDATVVLTMVGFDPYLGFYHRPKYGKPALALDLMEEFRPLIADSVVLTLLNKKEVDMENFVSSRLACALKPDGRKRVIKEYHRRLDSLVTHPVFGYSISYGRVLEVQARLLARWVEGEIPRYPFFHTR